VTTLDVLLLKSKSRYVPLHTWLVKPHLKSEHHVTNDAGLYGKISCSRMHNMLYKDPGNIAPKKFVKVNISAEKSQFASSMAHN
jgi:hypothetical protein